MAIPITNHFSGHVTSSTYASFPLNAAIQGTTTFDPATGTPGSPDPETAMLLDALGSFSVGPWSAPISIFSSYFHIQHSATYDALSFIVAGQPDQNFYSLTLTLETFTPNPTPLLTSLDWAQMPNLLADGLTASFILLVTDPGYTILQTLEGSIDTFTVSTIAVPEPGTLSLMAGGLLGIGWLRRRKMGALRACWGR
jgi:hypothetical protein